MKINNIKITNCRGIDTLEINNELIANRPYIFVAPNGFGKTSFAHAFSSIIGHRSIKLSDDDRYNNDFNNKSKVELNINSEEYTGLLTVTEENNSNDIRKYFDICVITNPQYIKATQQNFGSYIPPKGKMVIDPIEICPKVAKAGLPISMTSLKREFGNNNSLLFDMNNFINNTRIANVCFILLECIKTLSKERKYQTITNIKTEINSLNFTTVKTLPSIQDLNLTDCNYQQIHKLIKETFNKTDVEAFCCIWELVYLYKNKPVELESFFSSERYRYYKSGLTSIIDSLNSSKYKKANVNEKHGILNIELPEPRMISNGQRDVLSLVGFLFKAQMQLEKKYSILIIDELFDYLDDANMTVAQYYISQLIEDFKLTNRQLFPIILTHLNPNFFRNFVFKKQKVIYLNNSKYSVTPALQKLIDIRENESIKTEVSKYLFHYHTDDFNFQEKLSCFTGIRSSWGKKGEFYTFLKEEYNKYINNLEYDPLAVCAYTRIKIEENVYNMLETKKEEFLSEHKTGNKLNLASETGIDIPEAYFLLRIIYDEAMHSRSEKNNTAAIEAKLENPIIREMIKKISN